MEAADKNMWVMMVGGVPGVGKTFLSKRTLNEYNNIFDILYLNFDMIENINGDNYLQYQQMRNDYLLKINDIFSNIDNHIKSKDLLVILDDNFFLKSMRKKIYNSIIDKMLSLNTDSQIKLKFYYSEILLKPSDINYCLKKNLLRDKKEQIPDNIIINMNNLFEYNSPYANKNQIFILEIKDEQSLNEFFMNQIFDNKEKFIIRKKNRDGNEKNIINIEKDIKAKLIDEIEDIIRKEVNLILKNSEENRKKGKDISKYKKDYMKIIINKIKIFDNEHEPLDDKSEKNIVLFNMLKNCVINNDCNISQNKDLIEIVKKDFKNYLSEKKIYF